MLSAVIHTLRVLIPALFLLLSMGYVRAFIRNRESLPGWVKPLFVLGLLLQGLMLLLLGFEQGAFPFSTAIRGLFFCSFVLSLILFSLEFIVRDVRYGVFLLPANFLVTAFSLAFFDLGDPLPRSMMSYYYIIHVSLLFSAYACFLLSFILAFLYLVQYSRLKTHRTGALGSRLPPLENMDQMVRFMDALGLSLTLLGLITGFLWLDMTGGLSDSVSLKAVFIILSAACYLAEHMLRIGKGWQGQRACLLSMAGFLMVLCTLLVGRHGY